MTQNRLYTISEISDALAENLYLATAGGCGLISCKEPPLDVERINEAARLFITVREVYAGMKELRKERQRPSMVKIARKMNLTRNGLYCRLELVGANRDDIEFADSEEELVNSLEPIRWNIKICIAREKGYLYPDLPAQLRAKKVDPPDSLQSGDNA